MPENFPHLFSPIKVGPMTVRNRFLYPAHFTHYNVKDPTGSGRYITWGDRATYYYRERAKGGWGLIFTSVNHSSTAGFNPTTNSPEVIPSLRRMADAVHEFGAKIMVQVDAGNKYGAGADIRDAAFSPDGGGPSPRGVMTKKADDEDFAYIVESYVESARNIRASGMDGMEVHLTHGHMLPSYMSPATNHRTDQWGGSLENRLRMIMLLFEAVRKEVGSNFVIGARVQAIFTPAGMSKEEGIEVCRRLAVSGLLDYLNVSGAPYFGSTGSPRGIRIQDTADVKAAVDGKLPVFGAGDRIIDPAMAEEIIASGKADMVAMARAGIADPEFPNKAREGRLDDIRTCVGSGQGCLGYFFEQEPMMCIQNPAVGREREWGVGTFQPAPVKKRVIVIGAGPAGLEAALTAAKRGHQVSVYEKDATLGGQVNIFRKSPRRDDFRHVAEWRERQLRKLGVPVHLNTTVTAEFVQREKPDAVVVATGSKLRSQARFPGAEQAHVLTPTDVLQGKADGKKHVVIVDATGYYQGTDPLEYLTSRGVKVDFVTHQPAFAPSSMPMNDVPVLHQALQGKGVTYHINSVVTGATANSLELMETVNRTRSSLKDVDAVVIAIGADPVDDLYRSLKGKVAELHRVGDALTPRNIESATYEGHKIGRTL